MDVVVLSLGGSVLVKDEDPSAYLSELAQALAEVSSNAKLYIVTGGGRIARFYIRAGRALGAAEQSLDMMGIDTTRLNARLVITAMKGHACPEPPRDYEEAVRAGMSYPVVVMGGVAPGVTTDAVSARLAERVGATRLVNATSVDGAYTSDPKKDVCAKRIPRMSHAELVKLVSGTAKGAGPTTVFDPVGAEVLARCRIPLTIVDGRSVRNLKLALEGKDCVGTVVSS
ncbi:MAG: Uridylate kinase [Candidatus Thermoplasmatota archaeon]|nr:Uridylate kinase [Candidatus Thermoplasmatota archaeon]